MLPFIPFSLKSVHIPLPPISQGFPGDFVLLWGLMQGKLESSKRSLQALSGYEGWAVIPRTSLLQILFGGVLVKRKPALSKCLDQSGEKRACVRVGFSNRRDSPLLQLVRAFLRALAAVLPYSGLGFPIHSIFCARNRAWAGHPAPTPWSCCLVRWELWERKVSAEAAGPRLKT